MKKKSVRKAREAFAAELEAISLFIEDGSKLQEVHLPWIYDQAIIRLYRAFEDFMLACLVAAINNDMSQLTERTGVKFPKHLNDEVCEYLILGDGYFDFKGRDGLIKTVRQFVTDDHYLYKTLKKEQYKLPLEKLSALRNFAAHDSWPSKQRALKAIEGDKISSSGAWLMRQERFSHLAKKIGDLAQEIGDAAPY